ncbi:MAG: endonuclease III domain-containing protein [Candidatus Micrarchaeota archaeon]
MPERETRAFWLYRRLLAEYGPQGWWPTLDKGGNCVYHAGVHSIPRIERERVQIVVGALLATNTNWRNASSALKNLHSARKLSLASLASVTLPTLARIIRPSGYFNQKALRLKSFAKYVCGNYGCSLGTMFSGKAAPALRAELLSLHGVGPETADSILLYAARRPSFVVDAYTFRLNDRLGLCRLKAKSHEKRYAELQEYFESNLPKSVPLYNEFHALIVEWGKRNSS